MSDQPQGPEWWVASDGKWYPPRQVSETLWHRFRRWPVWCQVLMWMFLLPIPLALLALSRSGFERVGWWAVFVVAGFVWSAFTAGMILGSTNATRPAVTSRPASSVIASSSAPTQQPPQTTSTSGPVLLSADQVIAALDANGIDHRDNPAATGEDTPNDCDALRGQPGELGHVRQRYVTQLIYDSNPDDDADLMILAFDDAAHASATADGRKADTGRFAWPTILRDNIYIEIQMPIGEEIQPLADRVRAALDGLDRSASPVPAVLSC